MFVLSTLLSFAPHSYRCICNDRYNELMQSEFSEANLRELLFLLDVPDIDIIFCQARLETSNFTSKLFREENNLFGMHMPYTRDSYAYEYVIADRRSRVASYRSWQSSVLDLKCFIDYSVSKGYSTDDYYKFLVDVGYCEGDDYVDILKSMKKQDG